MTATVNTKARRGVLLVGHGTRDQVGTAQFFELGARLSEHLSPTPVESSLLEFQSPTIPEAWDALVQRGVDHIHVAPLLLFAAGHAKQDIPEVISECHARTPQITFDQSRPVSRHQALVDLATDRINDALAEVDSPAERTVVVTVGRGNRDACAQADMRVLSEVVSRRINAAATVTAFYAMAEPRLPVVLDQLASSGAYDAIIVQPHLLFEGRLYQAILEQTQDAAERHPQTRFATTGYLGPEPRVAEAIAARIVQPLTVR